MTKEALVQLKAKTRKAFISRFPNLKVTAFGHVSLTESYITYVVDDNIKHTESDEEAFEVANAVANNIGLNDLNEYANAMLNEEVKLTVTV